MYTDAERADEKVKNAMLSGCSDLGCHCRDGQMEIYSSFKFGAGSTLNRLPMTKSMSVLVDWIGPRLSYGRLLNSIT